MRFLVAQSKGSACKAEAAEDADSIPGLGRSPGGGNGNPLKYFCLENSMDRGSWQGTVQGVHKELDTTDCTHTHIPQILVFDVFSSSFLSRKFSHIFE